MFETIKCEESPQNPEMLFNKLRTIHYILTSWQPSPNKITLLLQLMIKQPFYV